MIEIRAVGSGDDLAALGRIIVDAYLGLSGWRRDPEYETWLGDLSQRGPSSVVLGAWGDGVPLGCVTYVPPGDADAEHDDPDAATIRALAVSPLAQGRRVGRLLAEACIERARTAGCPRVRLHSLAEMVVARSLYTRLGFVRDPSYDAVWELPDGPLHGLAYRLELS